MPSGKIVTAFDDRSMAIVYSVSLEDALESALRSSLVDFQPRKNSSVHDEMFRDSGALGSFGAKINLGLMIGLYSEEAWSDLSIIKNVRNSFAHVVEKASDFKADKIRSLCNNLKRFEQFLFEPPPNFDASDPRVAQCKFHHFELDYQQKLNNPRERYRLAVEVYRSALARYVNPPTGHECDGGTPLV
jgi:hypothetical protein